MEIDNLDDYTVTLYRLLNIFEEFEDVLQSGKMTKTVMDSLRGDLDLAATYEIFELLRGDIENIYVPKRSFAKKNRNIYRKDDSLFIFWLYIISKNRQSQRNSIISKNWNKHSCHNEQQKIYHSHITGEIYGYAHWYCNKKVRENYCKIPVVAHNLFRFDFFFLAKGLRASVWKTRDIIRGGKNTTDINFASIGNQVQFLDTIKYFQQSLGALANSLMSSEKAAIYEESKWFLMNDPKTSKSFLNLSEEDQDWVLNYLSSGKKTTPYQLIIDFDSFNSSPGKDFF